MPRWRARNSLYCVCGETEGKAVCSPSQNLDCKEKNSVTEGKCLRHNSRRRRSTKSHTRELERLFRKMQEPANHYSRHMNKVKRKLNSRHFLYFTAIICVQFSFNLNIVNNAENEIKFDMPLWTVPILEPIGLLTNIYWRVQFKVQFWTRYLCFIEL